MLTLPQALMLPGDGVLCTSAVIMNDRRELLLGLRHYDKKWEGELVASSLWTTPGGRTDVGETVGDCLVRESFEETGLRVTPVEYWGEYPAARSGDILHVFLCEHEGELQNKEPEKFERWGWFSADEIPDNFINPHLRKILLEQR